VLDKETAKKHLYEMLDTCNELLSKYKELRAKGMSKDDIFEAIWNTRKQTITEILELLLSK
jgi:hypothetical protein